MKVLILALLFVCAIPAAAQPVTTDPSEALKAAVKKFRNGKRFEVQYDKFKDQAWVSIGFYARGSGSFDTLTARVLLRGDGQKAYFLEWKATSGLGWRYLEHRDLYAIIDGRRAHLGEGKHDGKVTNVGRSYRSVTVREELIFRLAATDFSDLANGKSVEVRIGPTELKLKDEHLEAFRDLLSLSI